MKFFRKEIFTNVIISCKIQSLIRKFSLFSSFFDKGETFCTLVENSTFRPSWFLSVETLCTYFPNRIILLFIQCLVHAGKSVYSVILNSKYRKPPLSDNKALRGMIFPHLSWRKVERESEQCSQNSCFLKCSAHSCVVFHHPSSHGITFEIFRAKSPCVVNLLLHANVTPIKT